MAKQIYVDENGNPIEVSGTINNASMLPISANDSTDTKSYIDTGLSGKVGSDFIATQIFEETNYTATNNTDYTLTKDVTKAGYTPIGIVGFYFKNNYSSRFHFFNFSISSNTVTIQFRANSESFTTNNLVIGINVLYKKS